jgi:hypothetical protein
VLERYGGETFRNVAELLRQGQDAGQVVSGDPRELAVAYFAVIQGLALDALEPHPADRPVPRRATILRLLRA